jgi:triacylglycerol lipase
MVHGMIYRFNGLAPRRRVLVAGIALLVFAGGVTAAVAAVRAAPGQGTGAGQGTGTGQGSIAQSPPQDRPGPVLLVPGYGGNTGSLAILASRIRASGRQATVLPLPGNGTGSLVQDAAVLDSAVTHALRGGARSVDVIGYSAGGVATLLWARDYDGNRKARRVVTLGSPFHGASIAAAAEGFVPGACPAACQQLIPGSSLLAGLRAGTPGGLHWLSLWTTDDQTVTPPDSARLTGAINVPVQSVCPGQQISHSQLPTSPVVTAMVMQAIGAGPIQHPASADCRG